MTEIHGTVKRHENTVYCKKDARERLQKNRDIRNENFQECILEPYGCGEKFGDVSALEAKIYH